MGAESIVVVDPSVRVSSLWLSRMLWVAHQSENLGVLCAQMNDSSTLDFRAFLVTKRALDLVGGLAQDVELSIALADFVQRAQLAGLSVEQRTVGQLSIGDVDETAPLFSATGIVPKQLKDNDQELFRDYAPGGFLPNAALLSCRRPKKATLGVPALG